MPGIHVRTLGRLDWEDQDKEPTLTVPGSYWLCHKNHIYKFTFKFHKTLRNTTDFTHSKELMKVIRRVIKWQPKQGQHFSTKNLLVTYNHVPWTRHDKMFAGKKFGDRPGADVVQKAFILTVKVLNQEPIQKQTEESMGGLVAKSTSNDNATVDDLKDQQLTDPPPLVERPREKEDVNGMPTNSRPEKENKNDKNLSWSICTRSRHKDPDSPGSASLTRSNPEDFENESNGSGENLEADTVSSTHTPEIDCDWKINKSVETESKTIASLSRENVIDEDEDSRSSADSASLPYQYLIEKDIERELENSRNAKLNSLKVSESSESDAISTNVVDNSCDSSLNADLDNESKFSKDSRKSSKLKNRQDLKEKDSEMPPEVANLRSSDITDLVMKGLMFTIRQDEDTVTVVEQKTKLEVDEVLENSEKVETKEGDPCLLNSSLLRLEKMVTRIQEPLSLPEERLNGRSDNALASFVDLANQINIETERKLNMLDATERKAVEQKSNVSETKNCWSQFFGNKEISNSFGNIEQVLGDPHEFINDDNQDEDMELRIDDEEEEDIIPEALIHQSFFNNTLGAATMDGLQDLLTDDIQPLVDDIIDVEEVDPTDSSLETKENNLSKDPSQRPKIISNQIITTDQIPLALLKALKTKPPVQQTNSNDGIFISNETSLSENGVYDSENNNEVSRISDEKEISAKSFVENKAENTQDNKENNEKHSIQIDAVESNAKSSSVPKSVNNAQVISKSLPINDSIKDDKSQKSSSIKNNDISTSNLNSVDNIRLTRSNSKLYAKSREISALNTPSKEKQKCCHHSAEIYSQKILEKSSNKTLTRKRKRNSSESEKQEVTIKVQKLLNDLKYGVKIVVQRIDVLNTPS